MGAMVVTRSEDLEIQTGVISTNQKVSEAQYSALSGRTRCERCVTATLLGLSGGWPMAWRCADAGELKLSPSPALFIGRR